MSSTIMSQGSDARGGLCREKTEQKQVFVDQAGWVHTVPRFVSTSPRACSLALAGEFAVNIFSDTRALGTGRLVGGRANAPPG